MDKGYQRGEMERIALAIQNSDMRSDLLAANQLIERLRAENERLRAAGDELAEKMRLAIDARINEQLLLYGLATLPSEIPRSVVAWKEARRG